jgi:hypothetical protein
VASSTESSPRFGPRDAAAGGAFSADGPASPALSASSSQASWEEDGRAADSGVLVIMSYGELLNVLTGHIPPNVNNGSTPRVMREGLPHIFVLAVVRPGSDACEDIFPHYEAVRSIQALYALRFSLVDVFADIGSSSLLLSFVSRSLRPVRIPTWCS